MAPSTNFAAPPQRIVPKDGPGGATSPTWWLLILGLPLLLICSIALRFPEKIYRDGHLVGDQGFNLWATQEFLAGGLPGLDFSWQYGPIPLLAYAGFAKLFGNTPETQAGFHALGTLVLLAFLFPLIRRHLSSSRATLWTLLAVVPTLLVPGSVSASNAHASYPVFERAALIALMWFWQMPAGRTTLRWVGLGLILGVMQWIKFGGCFVAGAALLLTDILVSTSNPDPQRPLRTWWWKYAWLGAGFLALQGLWMALVLAVCPWDTGKDILWPSYMVKAYEVSRADRFPSYQTLKYFLGAQLGSLISLAVACVVVFHRRLRPAAANSQYLIFGLFFFLIAIAIYAQHAFLIYSYTWILPVAAVPFVDGLSRNVFVALLVAYLPGGVAVSRNCLSKFSNPRGEATPAGQYRKIDQSIQTRQLVTGTRLEVERLRTNGVSQPTVVHIMSGTGVGLNHALGLKYPFRNAWMLPAMFRPRDWAQVDQVAQKIDLIVISGARDIATGAVRPEHWSGRGRDFLPPPLWEKLVADRTIVRTNGDLVWLGANSKEKPTPGVNQDRPDKK